MPSGSEEKTAAGQSDPDTLMLYLRRWFLEIKIAALLHQFSMAI